MKNAITHWMIAAAALAIAAGSASAQTFKAEIPFSFRAAEKTMQPGSYRISVSKRGDMASFVLFNADTRTSAILAAGAISSVQKEWRAGAQPVFAFECAASTCRLRQMWDGSGGFAYLFPRGHASAGEVRVAVIALSPMKAD